MRYEITITAASELQYLQILVLAKYMALDLFDVRRDQFVVALEGQKIIGFTRLKNKTDLFELATMGVVRGYRGQGVGRLLIKYFTEKYENLHLVTCIPKHFEKQGFSRVEHVPECLKSKYNNTALWAGYGDPVVLVFRNDKED